MAARQRTCASVLFNFQRSVLRHHKQYFTQIACPFISRFSTSSKATTYQKASKDEPVAFSKSKAKFHTVDDTLGITKSKKSNLPLILGLGLFTVIIYFGFIRKDSNTSPETLEELLERMRILHEEKLKSQTVDVNESNNEVSD